MSAGGALIPSTRHWFFRPVPAHGLAFSRILLGVGLLFGYLRFLPVVAALFGEQNVATAVYALVESPFVGSYTGNGRTPIFVILPTPIALAVYGLVLVSAVSFALGLFSRTAGIILVVGHFLLHNQNLFAFWGWSFMATAFLVYVVLGDPGRICSLDAPRRRCRRAAGPAWPVRLLQVHVCCMYFVSGLNRLDQPNWQTGQMLYEALATFGRFPWLPLGGLKPLLAVATWVTLVLEPAAPLLLWFRRTGRWVALALIAMHVVLQLFADVGQWNFVMAAGLIHFLPLTWQRTATERIRLWMARLRHLRSREPGADGQEVPPSSS